MNTAERADILFNLCQTDPFQQLLGNFTSLDLMQWITHELGNSDILCDFQQTTEHLSTKASPHSPILHILSGNTPHAGLQSLLRGLLIGAENWIKLPTSGLPVVEKFIQQLPLSFSKNVKLIESLDDNTLQLAQCVIAIGSDETIQAIQARILPHQTFLPHGHKLSIGLIEKPSIEAACLAARDICSHNQQGCLSLHTIYVRENARAFLPMLADAMAHYESIHPRGEISLSESGAISNLRETIRYQAAVLPEDFDLIHSEGNTHWTAIYKKDPTLTPSPLNRFSYIQPWPANLADIGNEMKHLSTLAIHRINLDDVSSLDIPRICPLGKSQSPSLFWHHDGYAPLASLVKWRDIES